MTSGDGVAQAIPTYFGRTPMIEPNLMFGYPLFADPNQAYWYPVMRVMRLIPGAFNAYAVFPYVIVAFGTFGFAHRVSGSRTGAVVASLTVALGGFMMSHQGHLMIIHPACWAPCVLWAIDSLRARSSRVALAGGSIALALGLTAGTQQPVIYLLLVGCAYAVVFRPTGKARAMAFFRDVVVILFFGLTLAAIALIPAGELALRTDRARQSLQEFSVFSTGSLEFPIRAMFPYLLGANYSALYLRPFPAIGASTEATNYAGVFALLLGAIALLDREVRARAAFWLGTAVWSAWMALGPSLGAASIAWSIPFYGNFRIPGRHAFEWTFAIGILASLGVSAMESGRVSWRSVLLAIGGISAIYAIALTAFAIDGSGILKAMAPDLDVSAIPPLTVATDRALAIPVLLLVGACVVLVFWKRYANRLLSAVVIAAVACDMLVFAYGSYWKTLSTPVSVLIPPPEVTALKSRLERSGGRYLDLGTQKTASIPSNLGTLWGLPNATGYVSLEDRSFAEFYDASPVGTVPSAAGGLATTLDLTGVHFLLLPPDPPATVPIASALAGDSIDGFIGDAALSSQRSETLTLSQPHLGDQLQVVTALGNAVAIPNRSHVADLRVETSHGFVSFPLLAGVDTSESAYDRADVHSLVKHARATVFSGSDTTHLYITTIRLPMAMVVKAVSLVWVARATNASALTIAHIALLDKSRGAAYPFYADGWFAKYPSHFHERPEMFNAGGERVVEDVLAFPHAWLAHTIIVATPEEQRQAVHAGELNGRAIDFHRTALGTVPASLGPAKRTDEVTIGSVEPTTERYIVKCVHPCMLVTNDLWYPGWEASIDGARGMVVPVDLALRGVVVPAGTHSVEMWFAPLSLRIGIALTISAAIFLIGLLTFGAFPRLRQRTKSDHRTKNKGPGYAARDRDP